MVTQFFHSLHTVVKSEVKINIQYLFEIVYVSHGNKFQRQNTFLSATKFLLDTKIVRKYYPSKAINSYLCYIR